MKPLLGALSISVLILTGGCDRLQSAIVERMAGRALTGDRNDLLDDGKLHVVLCGTGSPLASPDRAGPCTAVLAGGHFLLVDVGPGSWGEVAQARLPRARLDGVLLTHFHSDHIGELGEATVQSWIAGRTAPLAIYGPPGVEQVAAGFRQAYALDTQYRVVHHGTEFMPPTGAATTVHTIELPAPGEAAVVFEADGLRVTAFAVDHEPVAPAYGYRFDYGGRSAVVSGDTKKSANLVRHATGADLLVHEALAASIVESVRGYAREHGLTRWAKLTGDVLTYHTTPVEAAEVAKAAGVQMLVFTHIVPPVSNFIATRMFVRGVSDVWDGEVVVGKDRMQFTLPPGGKAIEMDMLE